MKEFIIGIDDAGRGPVIGPMVLAGVLIEKKHEKILKEWGAKDSKLLIPKKRTEIAEKILNEFSHHITLTFPDEIDSRTSIGTNLNRIEAIKSSEIINSLMKGIAQKDINEKIKIIIDCPSPNTESWKNYLKKYIEKPELALLLCEHKADLNYISCSAASIIAKHTREIEIKKIKQKFRIDFGSGYASDPITQKFLDENLKEFENLGIIRKSWDTFRKAKAKREQKNILEF